MYSLEGNLIIPDSVKNIEARAFSYAFNTEAENKLVL
jgi:hypothetical protein